MMFTQVKLLLVQSTLTSLDLHELLLSTIEKSSQHLPRIPYDDHFKQHLLVGSHDKKAKWHEKYTCVLHMCNTYSMFD